MRRTGYLMRGLLAASVLIFASSCATPGPTQVLSPNAATFIQEPRPVPDIAVLTGNSAEGYRQHQRDKDEWGQRGWDRVNDLCLWFDDMGVDGLPCSAYSMALKP